MIRMMNRDKYGDAYSDEYSDEYNDEQRWIEMNRDD